jgi:SAM-dependent methyltransferase
MDYRKVKKAIDFICPTCRKLLVKQSLNRIDFSQFEDVLIVGAGRDPYRKMFSESCLYITMDVCPVAGVTQLVADAHELPVKRESFDCVLASEVFEHLSDPVKFVKAAFDILKPGGQLVITVPFMFHQHADPFDFWRPTKGALLSMFSGFSVCDVYCQGNRIHTLSDLITTSFYPYPVFYPLRIVNHLLALANNQSGKSTAPSGFIAVAIK